MENEWLMPFQIANRKKRQVFMITTNDERLPVTADRLRRLLYFHVGYADWEVEEITGLISEIAKERKG